MMKPSGPTLLAGAFLGLVGVAGYILASGPEAGQAAPDGKMKPIELAAATVNGGAKPSAAPAPAPSASVAAPAVAAAAADERLVIKRILPIKGPIKYGEWHWDDTNVPAGPIVVTVDLEARVISVFQGGYEIGAAAVLLGSQEKPTPTGVFPITQKKRDHTSNLYDAPMPYMQRLTNDGISLHATKVEWGYASHGCIGMPEEFARRVFQTTKLGDRVFITRGKMVSTGDSLVDS